MKKIIFAIAIVLTMGFTANAQKSDWFVRDFDTYTDDWRDATLPIILINGGVGFYDTDQSALPLSDGLLVLTILGAGYAVKKFRNGRK
jgi:hypothetical protein